MDETASKIVTGKCVHGRGNEFTVRDMIEQDGVEPSERTVVKEPNRYFFGWQTPRYEDMREYLEALCEYGFRLRESLKLIRLKEGYEIERVRNCTRMELLKNIRKQVTIGAVLKLLTKQLGKNGGIHNFVMTELYSKNPCMAMSAMADPHWGAELCKILEDGERLYKDRGLMVDPLGGAAIIGAFKYLFDPAGDPILSNLEKGADGKIILTDPGLMNVHNGERVSNIPGTRWLMALTLRLLGELGFEAMNMALRDYGNKIEPRLWGVSNAVPKVAAFLGYSAIRLACKFWKSRAGDAMYDFSRSGSCLS